MTQKIYRSLIVLVSILVLSTAAFAQVTKEDALQAINDSEQVLSEFKALGLPYLYINDTLREAKLAFQRAGYAELLAGRETTNELIDEAKAALEGLNYEGFSYSDVIVLTGRINDRKSETLLLKDSIRALQMEIGAYEASGLNVTDIKSSLDASSLDFSEERFNAASEHLSEARILMTDRLSTSTKFNAILETSKALVQKFWITLLILLLFIVILVLIFWSNIAHYLLMRKYNRMRIERQILASLIKKTQRQRYETAEISDYLYKIKIQKYNERLTKINSELPALKKSLHRPK